MTPSVLARLLEDLTALHPQEIDLNLVRLERLMDQRQRLNRGLCARLP
jgi:hypothetical protein